MRETVVSVLLGSSEATNRVAGKAIQLFYRSLSRARQRKLRVQWVVVSDGDRSVLKLQLPAAPRGEVVSLAAAAEADLWLVLQPEHMQLFETCTGVVVTTAPIPGRTLAKGIIRVGRSDGMGTAEELAHALRLIYDDPGLKEMMRRQRTQLQQVWPDRGTVAG